MTTLTMAKFTVRKTLKGEIISEKIEILKDDPKIELAFLGELYAKKLLGNEKFKEVL